jgi:hypothetical protein
VLRLTRNYGSVSVRVQGMQRVTFFEESAKNHIGKTEMRKVPSTFQFELIPVGAIIPGV